MDTKNKDKTQVTAGNAGVRAWLEQIGLPQYAEAFEDNHIELDVLDQLDHDTLAQLGVTSLGHRLKILRGSQAMVPVQAEDPAAAFRHAQPAAADWEAERRQLTIMFCDMVGSTAISTKLDPEDFRDLIRSFHEAVSEAAARSSGHVASFLGDGAMVYFGYPYALEDAAERAVNMGLELVKSVSRLEPYPGAKLQVRVGIATGLVVVGDLVGRGLNEGAVVSGETPNLAARLQAVATPDSIVVSDDTHRLLGRSFRTEQLAPQEIKGFTGKVTVWKILGAAETDDRFEAHRSRRLTPLVGRDAELKLLTKGWKAATKGQGGVFMLRGEAGLGKSRLLRELSEQTEATDKAFFQFQCSPYFANTALYPIRRMLEQASGFAREDAAEVRVDKLLTYFRMDDTEPNEEGALLAGMMGLPLDRFPPFVISVGLQRSRLFSVLTDRIRAAAERHPVIMFFEDLHWADPTTVELLEKLFEIAPDGRIFVVGTYRPEFEPPWAKREDVTLCQIRRLQQDDIQTIISHLAPEMSLPGETREALASRADGIPFFVEELTKSVVEMQSLQGDGKSTLAVPTSLRDTLMAQLDKLSSPRRVAQTAAVIGREFEEDLLSAISDQPQDELAEALAQLSEADLILPASTPGAWMFRHALIRDAAYESLLRKSRQELHLRIAGAIESLYPDRVGIAPEILARHYGEAENPERAARFWLQAARTARQRGAIAEAIAHVGAGVDQVVKMPASPERNTLEHQLHVTRGFVLFARVGYGSPEVQAAFDHAGELGANVDDPDILLPFHNGFGAHLTMRGDVAAGHAELSRMVDVAQDIPRLMIYAAAMQTWSHFNLGDFRASAEWGEKLEALYQDGAWDPVGPRHSTGDPRVICRCFHATSLWALGFPDQAAAMAQSALDHAETLNDPYSQIYAQVNGVCRVADLLGQTDIVLKVSSEAIDYAKQLGYDFAAGYSLFWKAQALAHTGELDTAIHIVTASLGACQAASVRYHEPHFRAMQAVMLAKTGDLEAATKALDGLEELVESSGEMWQAADIRCARAQVAEISGDDSAAERAWRDALATARGQGARAWELRAATGLADLLKRRGAGAEAKDLLAPVLEAFSEGFETVDHQRARHVLDQLT